MSKIVAIVNCKGGVGKTTLTVNLGVGLARKKKKTLLVDIDPNCYLTKAMLNVYGRQHPIKTIDELLIDSLSLEEVHVEKTYQQNLEIIASSMKLKETKEKMKEELARDTLLKELLSKIGGDYEYVLLDCPSDLEILTINALVAATSLVIPANLDFLSEDGIITTTNLMEKVKRRLNPKLKLGGVIVNDFRAGTKFGKEILSDLKEKFQAKLFQTRIKTNVTISEATSRQRSVLIYAPSSPGARMYRTLLREFMARI